MATIKRKTLEREFTWFNGISINWKDVGYFHRPIEAVERIDTHDSKYRVNVAMTGTISGDIFTTYHGNNPLQFKIEKEYRGINIQAMILFRKNINPIVLIKKINADDDE